MVAVGVCAVIALGAVAIIGGVATGSGPAAAPAAMCPPSPDPDKSAVIPTPTANGTVPPDVRALRAGHAFAQPAPASMPYPLPTSTGKTGREETVDAEGRVPSTGAKVTFSKFAAMGQAYRDYYITMLWGWAAWDFNGHSADINQAEYAWMNEKPRLVLVTNPRTGKSIVAAALEAGPGPWVSFGGDRNAAAHHWNGFERGMPSGFDGIVSGFPPPALEALDARTGYRGETGDSLTYQWAPDQSVTPGPTSAQASANGGVTQVAFGSTGTPCAPTSAPKAAVDISGVDVKIPVSKHTTYRGVDWSKVSVKAPNEQVAKGIAAGFNWLGTPYVWGGGGPKGPDHGCGRADCLPDTGFDCSGLTSYVMAVAGSSVPTFSGGQRDTTKAIPWNQAQPGDIIGYPGHVSIYLGTFDGQRLQLEAPSTGDFTKVSVVHRSDVDAVVYRWWNGATA